jgi:NAD-dependent dihydropyrimidine dehydrogenase PreA subunit
MTALLYLPPLISSLLMAAHYYRSGNFGAVLLALIVPFVLFIKRRWMARAMQLLLLGGGIVWITSALTIARYRGMMGQSSTRMFLILGAVAIFTALSGLVFETKRMRGIYNKNNSPVYPPLVAFLLTSGLLTVVQLVVKWPILLAERFIPQAGWAEIFILSIYAGLITEKMLDIRKSAVWRRRIWLIFSILFFGQLLIGVFGFDKFLMTGKLHLPVPALIAAGPIYRGEGFFMPILFITTMILVGPAWCSHLCYIGAWDNLASIHRPRPQKMPIWRQMARISILLIVIITAIIFRLVGASAMLALLLAIIFGLNGVGLMVFWSRKSGVMTHCVAYCPIGPLANWLGKLSPFRIKINDTTCTDCGICHTVCRYDALNMADIKKRRPNISCTLCGDCLGSCRDGSIEYHWGKIKGNMARMIFIVLVVSIHAVFLGVARM